ncbi:chromate efflux transporter [Actibacterium pelagium]|uniref:Membrane metal-ion transporter n=1 Tax=Actibacterium pelagium TaxID=2029103 RepID=A0A917EHY8_9RHOB|nr:chromate efflux transporter [Actibacterium pelagium]GGE46302.1 membrane metal-ion transporter [Actibacterium pelagium]
MSHEQTASENSFPSLWRLFLIFFKIGCVSWGGYMALVSVVRAEIVEKHRLLRDDEIMDGIALAMLLPGPVAVNVVAFVGNRLRGTLGAALCATAVILPSFFLMLGFATVYFAWEGQEVAEKALSAIIPAIAAVIANAALKMRGKALPGPLEWTLAAIAAGLILFVGGIWIVAAIIVGAATVGMLRFRLSSRTETSATAHKNPVSFGLGSWLAMAFLVGCLALFLLFPSLDITSLSAQLFSLFAGMSLMLFGGGYIFIPMVQEAVVGAQGWLGPDEFAASIALGQVTPGPILISATFVGYKVAGIAGAIVATIAIFLPPATLIVLAANQLERISHHAYYKAAQSGIRAVVCGMIMAAAVSLLRSIDFSGGLEEAWPQLAIFGVSLIALAGFKRDEVWVILAAGLVGLLLP